MRLTRPTTTVFWVSTVLSVLGILGSLTSIPIASQYSFLLVVIGNLLLWLGVVLKNF